MDFDSHDRERLTDRPGSRGAEAGQSNGYDREDWIDHAASHPGSGADSKAYDREDLNDTGRMEARLGGAWMGAVSGVAALTLALILFPLRMVRPPGVRHLLAVARAACLHARSQPKGPEPCGVRSRSAHEQDPRRPWAFRDLASRRHGGSSKSSG